ncbi:MAG TPA: formyltetrahydrofolate deformylase [Acidisarcina sp.]|nr:formyltetrahydrofolate deformylase [Acidisarcina sp.]
MDSSAILLLYCADRKGLVFGIAQFLLEHGGNILHADQHQDADLGLFFMRIEWSLAEFDLDERGFAAAFTPVAEEYGFKWQVTFGQCRPAVAIFVSHYQHCLVDLLYRHQIGEFPCRIALIISNHEDARDLASFHNIPFHFIPVLSGNKLAAERKQLDLLAENGIELVVLARYMQVLSQEFVARYPRKIINVHHSFLPAFVGAKPYHAAFQRGVKLIGATSHYVTEVLDEGPIIEQDVMRISHRDRLEDLVGKGRDLERVVLSRAVRWHLERRILCYGNKTVIFD